MENFRDYVVRWREQAARTFAEVIKVEEIVENGIKSGKIVSQTALKATTQVLQNGSGNIGGKKRRGDVATVVSASRTYVQDNPPQHYFHSQTPQYPVPYSPYPIFSAQPIVLPSYPQWRAPIPQNHPPPLQIHQNTARIPSRRRPQYKKGNRAKDEFTPIGESYASLLQKLRTLNVLSPIEIKMLNPLLRNLDYSQHCAYCFDAPRHNIDRCWYLERAIQDLIDTHRIIVESPTGPNINQNPLLRHTETNMLEMMNGCKEVAVPYKTILKVGTGMENSANVVDLTKTVPLGVERMSEKLSPSNTPILIVKGALENAWAHQREARLVAPRGLS
ncbi:hypothetical protein H5410_031016 [Solanum commersonii]|uniref:Uncharacterized protein n=1 Tax=Solanum commersonii TaxID=4109 RepID=A0A9J5YL20_SOLCO|nr:hypothetical protein H5410_031016 [Solanum commersonii]